MKTVYLLIIGLIVSFTGISKEKSYSVIKGKLQLERLPDELSLYVVKNGEVVPHSKTTVAKDGSFGYCFIPEKEGVYRIGERNSPARIYVVPGREYNFIITPEGIEVLNKSDQENRKLDEWASIINKIKKANMLIGNFTFKEIFPVIPDVEKEKDQFISGLKTGNSRFDNFLKGMAQAEFEYELYHFLFMPRTVHPEFKDQPEIYKRLSSKEHFATTDVLNYDFGLNAVASYLQYLFTIKAQEGVKYSPVLAEKMCIENVKNDTLKGWHLMNNQLLRAKTFDEAYRDKAERYKPYILTDDQKAKHHAFELTIRKMADGEAGINFSGTTVDGKTMKLSDFTGKVVLVDVWATWCGPCKKEIPALKQLEEEMHGKEVVFISYSVDKVKDHEKWKKFVADEQLGGVQLFGPADFSSPVCVDYKINAIPRFLLFDKKGNIITIDAPRPSDPKLKELVEKYLK